MPQQRCAWSLQTIGQGEERRQAESVDTEGIQVRLVRHEGRHEREPRRFNDESDAEIENRAAHEHHVLRVHENRERSVEVSISENMMVLQIAAHALGYKGEIGGLRDPMTNSLEYKLCK